MEFNLAFVFESVASAVPNAQAVIFGKRRPDDRRATVVACGQPW